MSAGLFLGRLLRQTEQPRKLSQIHPQQRRLQNEDVEAPSVCAVLRDKRPPSFGE
jgi:hypothetical protein